MGRVFISHSAKEPEASAALDELSAGLKEAGLTVLLDREPGRLNPGIEWRQEIHTWMALCNAAVVLFSPHALESDWVKKEATITSWRRSLDESFVFVPVLVPPTKRANLDAHGFGPLALDEIQFGGAAAVAQVVERLVTLVGTNPETPMEAWVTRLAFVLVQVEKRNAQALQRVAGAAGVDLDWDPAVSTTSERLARRLIHAGPHAITKAVESFADVLPPSENWLSDMVEILVPAWVDPVAVAEVPQIARRPAPPRAVAVNGSDSWVGESYVKRASCGSRRWLVLQANNVVGEDDDQQVDRIVREVLETARGEIRMSAGATHDDVLRRLRQWSDRGSRFVAVIPFGLTLTAEQVSTLQDRLDPVTLILLTGPDPEATVVEASHAVVLSPRLNEGDEAEAIDWRDYLRYLARPT